MIHHAILLSALTLISATSGSDTHVSLDLKYAVLTINSDGQIERLAFRDGTVWPGQGTPAFVLQTATETVPAKSISAHGDRWSVTFEDGAQAELQVQVEPEFALLRLQRLESPQPIERLQLLAIPVPSDSERIDSLSAAQTDRHFVAVMPVEPNVEVSSSQSRTVSGDRAGCQHQFEQSERVVKEGHFAARFTATCDGTEGGWSVQGRPLPRTLDLTGCRAIRAWVHGDGNRQALKIQLCDGLGGCRDNYLTIDFKGWRRVTLTDPPYDTLKYDRVTGINFYYNSLPASKTVTCLLDQVEAIVTQDGRDRTILLEDFEAADSPLWGHTTALLTAQVHARHGLQPAAVALIACPRPDAFDTIRRMEPIVGLPSPQPGGVWNKQSPWIKRSYFFLTQFRESQFDEALTIARRGGFHTILIDQGSWSSGTGHYDINRDHFPDGLAGLQRTVRKLHDAGFRVGFHFLGPSIYPPDKYITPIPDRRLVKGARTTLASDLDATTSLIQVTDCPTAFPAEDGGYEGDGAVLQIGDELILYSDRSVTAPFEFRKCQRGYLGTTPAAHRAGDSVAHLVRSYGYHLFDMDTDLLDEVAANFARVANACQIDMVYFDGSERLQGDHWYYNARLHKAFYDRLENKDMLLQASSYSPYSWHILARSASADGHGDLKGYLDERSPWFDSFARGGMPLDIGWYYGYDTSTPLDMYEYVLGATIGYDSSMSFQVSVDAAARHPFTGEILDLIQRYEQLRLSGRVPEEMRRLLRIDPALGGKQEDAERAARLNLRRDYRLVGPPGKEVFQRVFYCPWHDIDSSDATRATWSFNVPTGPAQVGVQIQALSGPWFQAGPAYSDPEAMLLESFEDLAPYARAPDANAPSPTTPIVSLGPNEAGAVLPGVTQQIQLSDEGSPVPGHFAIYTATSSLPSDEGWSVLSRSFAEPLDISWHRGLGFWLRGDGRGGLFKLQLSDGRGAMDYYIKNDFQGWQYQQLTRPDQDAIDYTQVRGVLLYYNGLPGNSTIACGVDDVKALRGLDTRTIVNPTLELEGTTYAWQGRVLEGQYLTIWPGEPARLNGSPLTSGESGPVMMPGPDVSTGPGEATIRTEASGPWSARVRVLLQLPERHPIP